MICESCGMPMEAEGQHGGGDPKNTWCIYCCYKDGTHKSRKEVRECMIDFMLTDAGKESMRTMGQEPPENRKEAEEAVDRHMSRMPAWKK
jgi:hypothetical protein